MIQEKKRPDTRGNAVEPTTQTSPTKGKLAAMPITRQPGLSRRTFLGTTAAAAIGAATPAIPREHPISRHEQALWHIRELERLVQEEGANSFTILVVGHGMEDGLKSKMLLRDCAHTIIDDDLFSGGAA